MSQERLDDFVCALADFGITFLGIRGDVSGATANAASTFTRPTKPSCQTAAAAQVAATARADSGDAAPQGDVVDALPDRLVKSVRHRPDIGPLPGQAERSLLRGRCDHHEREDPTRP